MTIPDGYVLELGGHKFFWIEMLRPQEDVPGDYLTGKAWLWKAYDETGHQLGGAGFVKDRASCKRGVKRAAARWLRYNG